MERTRRLAQFWSWLPAFRAVAESEHLPTASELVHVSPSALSRTVRLLEEEVGQALFDRVGRGLVLNAAGTVLLGSVRDAMRLLDEGLNAVNQQRDIGDVRITASGPLARHFILPALDGLAREHAGLTPFVEVGSWPAVSDQLKRGEIDIAICEGASHDDDLQAELIAGLSHRVYCRADHPLKKKRGSLNDASFAAPIGDMDLWPSDRPRRVGLRVHQMQVAIDACKDGNYVSVLPDVIAEREGLVSISPVLGATNLFAVRRAQLPGVESHADIAFGYIRDAARRTE